MNVSIRNKSSGFTIVELLVVMVIIGILAAITIVTYTGIVQKAKVASLISDLSSATKKLDVYKARNSTYPTLNNCPTPQSNEICLTPSSGTILKYVYNSIDDTYTLEATNSGLSYNTDSTTKTASFGTLSSFAVTLGAAAGADVISSIVQTGDGGYVVVGNTSSYGAGGADMYIGKYTPNGTLSWNKTWGGVGNDYGSSIIQTSDGGYAVTGYETSFGAGGSDMFIVKYTSDGTLSWNKTWGGVGIDNGNSIIQTNDGGYAVTGYTENFGAGVNDMFIVKYTSDGTLSWNKTWGGVGNDYGSSIIQTSDGGYSIASFTTSFGLGANEVLLVKYTSDGTLSWATVWGGTGADSGSRHIQTSDGGFAVTGLTNSFGAGGFDVFLNKYTSSGTLSWSKTWGGIGTEAGYGLVKTGDNDYVISGYTASYGAGLNDLFLIKFKSDGNLLWNKTFGGVYNDYSKPLIQATDGSFVTGGYTNSYGTAVNVNNDMLLVKYTSNGMIIGCSSPMCQIPSATVTSPSGTVSNPSGIVTSPTATVTSPTATVTSPTGTYTVVVPAYP